MKTFEISSRLRKLPPYLFAEIDCKKSELRKKGIKFFDLSIGDPDILAPKKVIDTLYREAKLKENQKYALDEGKLSLRKAISRSLAACLSEILELSSVFAILSSASRIILSEFICS